MHILVYGDKQMKTTKIVIAVVAVAALALVAVGLASAQIQANQTYTGTAPQNGGFFGWLGSCFGLGGNQAYYGTSYQAPQGPVNATAPETYVPYQGGYYANGYGYGYGYGSCWAR
jgi:hypothetical protein